MSFVSRGKAGGVKAEGLLHRCCCKPGAGGLSDCVLLETGRHALTFTSGVSKASYSRVYSGDEVCIYKWALGMCFKLRL